MTPASRTQPTSAAMILAAASPANNAVSSSRLEGASSTREAPEFRKRGVLPALGRHMRNWASTPPEKATAPAARERSARAAPERAARAAREWLAGSDMAAPGQRPRRGERATPERRPNKIRIRRSAPSPPSIRRRTRVYVRAKLSSSISQGRIGDASERPCFLTSEHRRKSWSLASEREHARASMRALAFANHGPWRAGCARKRKATAVSLVMHVPKVHEGHVCFAKSLLANPTRAWPHTPTCMRRDKCDGGGTRLPSRGRRDAGGAARAWSRLTGARRTRGVRGTRKDGAGAQAAQAGPAGRTHALATRLKTEAQHGKQRKAVVCPQGRERAQRAGFKGRGNGPPGHVVDEGVAHGVRAA